MKTYTAKLATALGPNPESILTIDWEYEPGRWARLMGRKPRRWSRRYIGGATVWRTYPEFRRCATATEAWLGDVEAMCRHRRQCDVLGKAHDLLAGSRVPV
jgi:hypothetical protein